MSKINCNYCGFENDDSGNYCINCGKELPKKPNFVKKIINLFSFNKNPKKLYNDFLDVKEDIVSFNKRFDQLYYIDESSKTKLKEDNESNYELSINLKNYFTEGKIKLDSDEVEIIDSFMVSYRNIDSNVKKLNNKVIQKKYEDYKKNKDKYLDFISNFKTDISYLEKKSVNDKDKFKKEYDSARSLINFEKKDDYDFGEDSEIIHLFVELYEDFDNIITQINTKHDRFIELKNNYEDNEQLILDFLDKYDENVSEDLFIDDFKSILKNYNIIYDNCIELSRFSNEFHLDEIDRFIKVYNNFKEISKEINFNYMARRYDLFLDMKEEIQKNLDKFKNLTADSYLKNKKQFIDKYSEIYNDLIKIINNDFDYDKGLVYDFVALYVKFNGGFPNELYKSALNSSKIKDFIKKYGSNFEAEEYIWDKKDALKDYEKWYNVSKDLIKLYDADELDLKNLDEIAEFIELYDNFDEILKINNEKYVNKLNNQFLDDKKYILDFIDLYDNNKPLEYYVDDEEKSRILKDNKIFYNLAYEMNQIPEISANNDIKRFISIYDNFDEVVFNFNRDYVNKIYDENAGEIKQYYDIYNKCQNYYVSNSRVNELLDTYDSHLKIVNELLGFCSNYNYLSDKSIIEYFPKNYYDFIESITDANEAFIQRKLVEDNDFFENVVMGKSLDENQRRAVLIDEDNTQIIAGAGSGKTLTLQSKAKYLIEKKNINPDEILAISFSTNSAIDLKRKMEDLGLNIDVSTFHSLGLDVLRYNGINAKVDEYALKKAIKEYFHEKIIDDSYKIQKIIEYFGYYMYQPLNKEEIKNIGEEYEYENGMDLETFYSKFSRLRDKSLRKTSLKGEKVKSLEERKIANFLFINGVKYTYEKDYQPKYDWQKSYDYLSKHLFLDEIYENIRKDLIKEILVLAEIDENIYWPNNKEKVSNYNPDFYLDDYDIYYEHFGVNRKCLAPWLPPKKSREYKKSMRNKQLLHKKYGTKLIETYSYYNSENRLLNRLEEKLIENGVEFNPIDYVQIMDDLLNDEEKISEYWDFILLVETFINLFKGNGYSKDKFNEFRRINENSFTLQDKEKHEMFLDIVEDIYDNYYDYLKKNNLIDFNDMINDATEIIINEGYYKNYKYILVDEYQDTSHTRYNFLKAIKDDSNPKLIVVGDDWQSIYRFTGCDIDLFTNFQNYFPQSRTEICYITNTYRNSQDLIDISGKFIMENSYQFKKQLISKSNNQIENSIILYQYTDFYDTPFAFEKIIQDIYKSSQKNLIDILVLGRNRKDYKKFINEDLFYTTGSVDDKNLKIHYKKNPKISIRYMTVHGSKGLEADNVVLINLENKQNGFPNKKEDDSVLNFVKNEKTEPIEFAEERRLFYVALTRTKQRTYLLAPKDKKSIFVNELMEDIEINDFKRPFDENTEVDGKIRTIASTDEVCPECGTGKINLRYNPKSGKKFFKCSNWPKCDWFGGLYYDDLEYLDNPEYCPRCGGLLIKRHSSKNGGYFYGCINYFPDHDCKYTRNIS